MIPALAGMVGFRAKESAKKYMWIVIGLIVFSALIVGGYMTAKSHGATEVVSKVREAENKNLGDDLQFCRDQYANALERQASMTEELEAERAKTKHYEYYLRQGTGPVDWPPEE